MSGAQQVLDELVRAVREEGFGAHAVHVLVGEDSAVHHWSPDVRRDIHSVAKGVCVLAAGMADDEGVFDVDAPVRRYLPELGDDELGDDELGAGVDEVTTRHLLSMTSGIDLPWTPTWMTDWPDLAHEYLSRPSAGRVFQYSTASTYTAMRALAGAVGDVRAWLTPRLFEPLGIEDPVWVRCPKGAIAAADGLLLTVDELARIGRLIRDDGLWQGRRLVAPRWPRAMRSDWVERDASPAYSRYSLAGWGGPGDAWRLHGAYGQMLIFHGDAVVTVTADDHAGADPFAERVVEVLAA